MQLIPDNVMTAKQMNSPLIKAAILIITPVKLATNYFQKNTEYIRNIFKRAGF